LDKLVGIVNGKATIVELLKVHDNSFFWRFYDVKYFRMRLSSKPYKIGRRINMKNKIKRSKILLTIFIILTLISLITLLILHQTPIEKEETNILCTYESKAAYKYTAILAPNIIYNNKTTLKPGEGTIYSKITKQINVTLTYSFEASLPPLETEITYSLEGLLKTSAWNYKLYATTPTTINQTQIKIEIPSVNKTEVDNIKRKIELETGTSSTEYTLEITPTFTVNASTTNGPIYQIFKPTLLVEFKRTEQGDIIEIENLNQTKPGSITSSKTILLQDVINQRYAAYILSAASVTGLGVSIYLYRKYKPPKSKEEKLEEMISPYKDLIIEAEQPQIPRETTVVNVKSIEDMGKTAEILAKPILLTKKPQPTLIIIDQNVVYEHKI